MSFKDERSRKAKTREEIKEYENRKTIFIARLVLGLRLRQMGQSAPSPDGGPTHSLANEAPYPERWADIARTRRRGLMVAQRTIDHVRANASSEAIPEGENFPGLQFIALIMSFGGRPVHSF